MERVEIIKIVGPMVKNIFFFQMLIFDDNK